MTTGTSVGLRLLGGFALSDEPSSAVLRSPKLQSLLGYLVVNRSRPLARGPLAFRFWPDSTEEQARTNLRQALHHLRRAVPMADRVLVVSPLDVQWCGAPGLTVDLVLFEDVAARGLTADDPVVLGRALDAYGGDLLPDCYDDWVAADRARLRARYAEVLSRAAIAEERWGNRPVAISRLEELVRVEPLSEDAHRRLALAHLTNGDHGLARQAVATCRRVLRDELGVEPSPETIRLEGRLAAAATGRNPGDPARPPALVGRELEWAELDSLRRPADESALLVVVSGEPGIGKTRLAGDFVDDCARRGWLVASARAYNAEGGLPLAPIVDLLRSPAFAGVVEDTAGRQRELLGLLLPELGQAPPDGSPAGAGLTRTQLFDAVAGVLLSSGARPVALLVDDLHWCDAETLQFLHYLLRVASTAGRRLLVLATARPEAGFHPATREALVDGLRASGALVDVRPAHLSDADAATLVANLLPGAGDRLVRAIVDRSDGNPLFLVELAGHARRPGARAPGSEEVPPALRATIAAQLRHLTPAARAMAELAAVAGTPVELDQLGPAVAGVGGRPAADALDEVVRSGLLVPGDGASPSYGFRHDLVRDGVLSTVEPGRRRLLHRQVASALEEQITSGRSGLHGRAAVHHELAGSPHQAVHHLRAAIEEAVRLFAFDDAVVAADRALALLDGLPADAWRDRAELDVRIPLAAARYAGPGFARQDSALFERIEVLSARVDRPAATSTIRLMANAANSRRDFATTHRVGRRLFEGARRTGDDLAWAEAHYTLGVASCWLGRHLHSRRHLESALSRLRTMPPREHIGRFGQDPVAVCLSRLAFASLQLDELDSVDRWMGPAEARAASCEHSYTRSYVRGFHIWIELDRGRVDEAAALLDGFGAETPGNTWVEHMRLILRGWLAEQRGEGGEAVALLDEAVAYGAGPTGAMMEPLALLRRATAVARFDDPAAGLHLAGEARELARTTMPFHLPEALRLEAVLLTRSGGSPALARHRLDWAERVAARQRAHRIHRRVVADHLPDPGR